MTTRYLYDLIKDEPWAAGLEYDTYLEAIHGPTFTIIVVGDAIGFSRDYLPNLDYLDLRDPESLDQLERQVRCALGTLTNQTR